MATMLDQSSFQVDHPTQADALGGGRLGVVAITFFVVSAAGPLVAMAGGIPVAMLFGNGAGVPALFLGLTILLLLFSLGYMAMAREVCGAGAFYMLVRTGLGAKAGGAAGLIALLSYNAMQVGLYGMFGAAADGLMAPLLSRSLPWWTYALPAMLSIGWFGYRQIDLSVRLLGALCVCEYLVVLILDGFILAQGGAQGLSLRPFAPDMILSGAPMLGLMLSFGAFIGFEATTIYSEEARDPARSIPIATYLSLIVIGVFYTFSTWAMVLAIGAERVAPILHSTADPTTLLFDIAAHYAGGPLVTVMRLLFVTSIYAAMLAFHNAIARYILALGRDAILPGLLGTSHPVHRSPYRGSLAQSCVALLALFLFAISGSDPILTVFTLPTALGTLGILALMVLASLAVIAFFVRRRAFGPRRAIPALLACVGLAAITLLATTRFDLLTGGRGGFAIWLPALILLAALAGACAARCRPLGVEQEPSDQG